MPNLTDLKTIRALCERHGFSLSKGFGQNFIVNPGICPKMVEAAGIDRTFGVLEIGPGVGVLTKEAALRAALSPEACILLDDLLRERALQHGAEREAVFQASLSLCRELYRSALA